MATADGKVKAVFVVRYKDSVRPDSSSYDG
jgi:hypothetical protein